MFRMKGRDGLDYYLESLPCGMQVVGQPLAGVQSAAFGFFIPAGARDEPAEQAGLAHLTESILFRGTKNRSARQLTDELDRLGVARGSSSGVEMSVVSGVLLGDHLDAALDPFVDVIRNAAFDPEDVDVVRGLQLQEIGQRQDQPAQLVMDRARRMFFAGDPTGNDVLGTVDTVSALSRDQALSYWSRRYRPNGMIMAIAGSFAWKPLVERLNRLCEGWDGGEGRGEATIPSAHPEIQVEQNELAQENICFVFKGLPQDHPDYYAASLTSMVLGGGMNSRLHTEVREKRGLAYTVQARFDGMQTSGIFRVYAATQPERASETVAVIRTELNRLDRDGVTAEELALAKTRLKSRVVMSSESTGNRAMTIGRDWWYRQRFRTLHQIREEIDAVTVESIARFLALVDIPRNTGVLALGPLSQAELGLDGPLQAALSTTQTGDNR